MPPHFSWFAWLKAYIVGGGGCNVTNTTGKWAFVWVHNPHLYRVLNRCKASSTNVVEHLYRARYPVQMPHICTRWSLGPVQMWEASSVCVSTSPSLPFFFPYFLFFLFFSSPILKQDHEQLILNHRTYNPSYKSYISQTLKNHNQSHQCIKNIEKSTTTRTRASHLPTPPLGHAAHASPSHAAPARCWARPGTTPRAPIVQIERDESNKKMGTGEKRNEIWMLRER
jgi:hypothetical protein